MLIAWPTRGVAKGKSSSCCYAMYVYDVYDELLSYKTTLTDMGGA